jgi:hypothetical protein
MLAAYHSSAEQPSNPRADPQSATGGPSREPGPRGNSGLGGGAQSLLEVYIVYCTQRRFCCDLERNDLTAWSTQGLGAGLGLNWDGSGSSRAGDVGKDHGAVPPSQHHHRAREDLIF